MKDDFVIETTNLLSCSEELSIVSNYYSQYANNFLASNFNASNCVNLSNYLSSVRSIYGNISLNIRNIGSFINNLQTDMTNLENKYSSLKEIISYVMDDINYFESSKPISQIMYETSFNTTEFTQNLLSMGFLEADIQRILSGEINFDELYNEIMNEEDNTRRKHMLEVIYLQGFGFTSFEQMQSAIEELELQKKELEEAKTAIAERDDLALFLTALEQIKNGESINSVFNTIRIDLSPAPEMNGRGETVTRTHTLSSYLSSKGHSDWVNELYNLTAVEGSFLFFKTTTQNWNGTDDQLAFYNEMNERYKRDLEVEGSLSDINGQLNTLDSLINSNKENIDYFMELIEYQSRKDFNTASSYTDDYSSLLSSIEKNIIDARDVGRSYVFKSIDEEASFLALVINRSDNTFDKAIHNLIESGIGYYDAGKRGSLTNDIIGYLDVISEQQKQIYTYKYHKEGSEAALEYLESIIPTLDKLWIEKQQAIDKGYAQSNAVLASLYSVFGASVDGISSLIGTLKAKIFGNNILRKDVYMSSQVYQSTVSQLITEETNSEFLAFLYNTGISMAQSVQLIALSAATGGTGTVVLSAGLMGSRAYGSALNDALDRGLSDNQAIAFAAVSAIVETAMESYSAGHLLDLEKHLGSAVSTITKKISQKITNENLAKIATKTFYIFASSVSQGIAEGEEEFATEVLNNFADNLISGELSKFSLRVSELMNSGMSEDEAIKLASDEYHEELLQAFEGGFASGFLFGAAGGAKTSIQANKMASIAMNSSMQSSEFKYTAAEAFADSIKSIQTMSDFAEEQAKKDNLVNQAVDFLKSSVKDQLEELFNPKVLNTMNTLKKFALGVGLSVPSTVNKFRIETVSSNADLLNKVLTDGMVHITNEDAVGKILDSGYIKASKSLITSYGLPKAYLFAGNPGFGEVCLNLNMYSEKLTGVRIRPDADVMSDTAFKYRAHDDYAISHRGDFYFDKQSAEQVYYGLASDGNGNLYYKEITKSEYDNYKFNPDAKEVPNIIKKLSSDLKGFVYGFAYQYDLLSKKVDVLGLKNTSEQVATNSESNLEFEDLEITAEMPNFNGAIEVQLDEDSTAMIIPISNLVSILSEQGAYNDFISMEDGQRKLYAMAIGQLVEAIQNKEYNFALSNEQLNVAKNIISLIKIENFNSNYANANEAINNKTDDINLTDKQLELTKNVVSQDAVSFSSCNELVNNLKSCLESEDSYNSFVNFFHETFENQIFEKYGFSSSIDFKKSFIQYLIESDLLNSIDNNIIATLMFDDVCFKELIGTEKLSYLFIKNLTRLPDMMIKNYLMRLDQNDFNRVFEKAEMKQFLSELSPKDLAMLLSRFDSFDNISWLHSDSIVDRIIDMNIEDFYQFIKILSGVRVYTFRDTLSRIEKLAGTECLLKFYKAISNKFFNIEIAKNYPEYVKLIKNSFIFATTDLLNSTQLVDYVNQVNNTIVTITNTVIENSDIEISTINGRPGVKTGQSGYYTITYEISGKIYTVEHYTSLGQIYFDYDFMLDSNARVLSIERNDTKSNLVLSTDQGLKKGLNEVTFIIDGVEIRKVIELKNTYETIDLNTTYENVHEVQLVSVLPIESYNLTSDGNNKVYTVKYEVDGKIDQVHILATDGLINIDKYIAENNLFGVRIVEVSPVVDLSSLYSDIQGIDKYQSANEIFAGENFGGDQSSVQDLLTSDGTLSIIDRKKADVLLGLINKYFPNIEEHEIRNLAGHYSESGCVYMAVANAFITYISSLENGDQIFKDRFGYDLFFEEGTKKSYNMESLAFNIYLEYAAKVCSSNDFTVVDFMRDSAGVSINGFDEKIAGFWNKYGIDFKYTESDLFRNDVVENLYLSISKNDGFNIIIAQNFDVELISGKYFKSDSTFENHPNNYDLSSQEVTVNGNYHSGYSGHAMLLTDVDENGRFIVSSWATECIFYPESVVNRKGGYVNLLKLFFSIMN